MSLKNKQRILIVEDMPNWRRALVALLQDEYEIVLSKTYEEADGALHNDNIFDLIILDIRLGDENTFNVQGIQLLRMIKEHYTDIPVAILTGYPDIIREEILEHYRPDAFFLKVPIDIDELKDNIKELANRKSSNSLLFHDKASDDLN